MTLPKQPPILRVWNLANTTKRLGSCRLCNKTAAEVKKLELAHVMGCEHDLKETVIGKDDQGRPRRLCLVLPSRVIELCGPAVDTGTCHNGLDTHQMDVWDVLSPGEKKQAIEDAGGLGQALKRCAPLTWQDRIELDKDGNAIEVQLKAAA